MNDELNFQDFADFTQSFSHYKSLRQYYPQLDSKNELLQDSWQSGDRKSDFSKSNIYKEWWDISIHIVNQLWSSTSCGWGGIGGAAMTYSYSFIVHQKVSDLYFVYWNGKLAYICNKSEISDLNYIPYLNKVKAIYKSKK